VCVYRSNAGAVQVYYVADVTSAQDAVFAYAILSRMAYVLFVGGVLRREEGAGAKAFRRFKRRAAIIMNHDAFAFVLLCVVTRNTWQIPLSPSVLVPVGAALVVIGLGTKLWAARTLGTDAYYWHNFFEPDVAIGRVSTGPYRFISSPMYTVGYLQTYGLALMLRSFPGLIASVFSQAAILVFYFIIEKPHFERLHRSS
jgi:protein-S-isoprenylcysteine O-methyltransferase Ste14